MKKTLVAIAALAAFGAQAQSSVGIKGTFDPALAVVKSTYGAAAGTDGKTVTQQFINNNTQGTSQITFFGTEDLGGGMKANFLLENDFDTRFDANGNPVNGKSNLGSGGGEQYLGLQGGFGNFQVGAPNTPSLTTQSSRQPFSTKIGSGFGSSLGTKHVRNNNAVVYTSPDFNGFTASYGYAFGTTADLNTVDTAVNISTADKSATLNSKNVGAISDLGLNYANGPLKAGVSMYSVEQIYATTAAGNLTATTAAGKNSQTNMYAQYALGAATLYVGAHKEKTENASGTGTRALDASGTNVAVKYAVTPRINFLANYAKLNDKLSANKDVKTAAFGAQYELSKRTVAYVRSVSEKTDNQTTTTSVAKLKGTYFGVQHNF